MNEIDLSEILAAYRQSSSIQSEQFHCELQIDEGEILDLPEFSNL